VALAALPQAPSAASPPEDGNWIKAPRDYASTRYSGLEEIGHGPKSARPGRDDHLHTPSPQEAKPTEVRSNTRDPYAQ
jgi:hypothetical protein